MVRSLAFLAALILGSTAAHASIPLCFHKKDVRIQVPPNPTLVLESDAAAGFVATDRNGQTVTTTTTPIDAFWARVEVHAPAGAEVVVPALAKSCKVRSVTLVASAWVRDDRAPTNVSALRHHDTGWLTLQFDPRDQLARMRVDWAYSRADLNAGIHGTRIEVPPSTSALTTAGLWVRRDFELVFIRLTPLLLDGSTGRSWDGWAHRDAAKGTIRVGDGPPPITSTPPQPCAAQAAWVAGEQPTFAYEGFQRTFLATGADGRVLPTTVTAGDGFTGFESTTDVTIAAVDRDKFTLEVLPRGSACPLDVVVQKGATAPRIVTRSRDVRVSSVSGPFTDDERFLHRLGNRAPTTVERHRIRVRTGEQNAAVAYGNTSWRGESVVPIVSGALVVDTSYTADDWGHLPSPRAGREGMRVIMAPVRDGFRAAPCELWLLRDQSGKVSVYSPAARHKAVQPSCLK